MHLPQDTLSWLLLSANHLKSLKTAVSIAAGRHLQAFVGDGPLRLQHVVEAREECFQEAVGQKLCRHPKLQRAVLTYHIPAMEHIRSGKLTFM